MPPPPFFIPKGNLFRVPVLTAALASWYKRTYLPTVPTYLPYLPTYLPTYNSSYLC